MPPLTGDSTSSTIPGVKGTNSAENGVAVYGESQQHTAVYGLSHGEYGVSGVSRSTYAGVHGSNLSGGPGVHGLSNQNDGVLGQSTANQHAGVTGYNGSGGVGVSGRSESFTGASGPGVYGSALGWDAIVGETQSDAHAGVTGRNLTSGANGGVGVYGKGGQFAGKFDGPVLVNQLLSPISGFAIYGSCPGFDAIVGETQSDAHAGVTGRNLTTGANGGVGIYGRGGRYAGKFDGDVQVNGKLNIGSPGHPADVEMNGKLNIASGGDVIFNDCAEHFDVVDAKAEPGTVMVIDQDGNLRPSSHPYDKKVAGVVSGAGNFRPGIILGKQQSQDNGLLIALLGKVYCKVDAQDAAIEIGDLLTTSPTLGHAMKADDPVRAFGAVIGKALKPLKEGQGLIPILVALQ